METLLNDRKTDRNTSTKMNMLSGYFAAAKRNIASRSARTSYMLLAGNALTQGLSFLVTTIIARTLGPYDYGIFAVVYILMIFSIDIVDFGLEKSFVRYYSLYSLSDQRRANQLFNDLLILKLSMGILLCLIIFFFSGSLAKNLLHKPDLAIPLKIGGVGLIGGVLLRFQTIFFQASEQFKKYILVNLGSSILRIMGLVVLIFLNLLSVDNLMVMYATVYFSGLIFSSLLLPKLSPSFPKNIDILSEIFRLSKWIFISTVLVMIDTRLDFVMLGHFSSKEEVGFFAAAWNLAYAFPLVIGAVCTTFFPKISRMSNKLELKNYVNKLMSLSPLIIPMITGAVLLSKWVVLLLYGPKYLPCVAPLKILFAGYSLILLVVPVSLVLYALNKSWVVALINLLELVSHGFASYYLIPLYGASGAAASNFIVRIVTTVGTLGFIYFFLRRKDNNPVVGKEISRGGG